MKSCRSHRRGTCGVPRCNKNDNENIYVKNLVKVQEQRLLAKLSDCNCSHFNANFFCIQALKTDLERVSYVIQQWKLQTLQVEENYSSKSEEEATTYEEAYDMLILNEASASKGLEVIQRSIQKTPPDNNARLAIRSVRVLAFLRYILKCCIT